ncbi:protein SODIUM POTASSIUM ROOT DEFECTIVE [Salix suchowensis]|nr:protein SODIUM POTASSIUM ROOT DEFECTIVE [Salix suchowensis]
MKMIDLFCASPASTAICSSLDHRSIVRHGTRPCSSELPASPCSPCSRKSSARQRDLSRKSSAEDSRSVISSVTRSFSRRKSSAEDSGSVISSATRSFSRRKSSAEDSRSAISSATQSFSRRKSSADDISDLKSRPVIGSSSRFLLSDTTPYIDWISESDHHEVPAISSPSTRHANSSIDFPSRRSSSLVRSRDWVSEADNVSDTGNKLSHMMSSNDSPALRSSSSTRSSHQVVVLRVSIHCKGCEGKVRKHISKMEGVTSFSIDFGAKKVTVIGDVTPSGVLASISKVKNAQLWPSATASPSPSPSPSPLPRWST